MTQTEKVLRRMSVDLEAHLFRTILVWAERNRWRDKEVDSLRELITVLGVEIEKE